MKRFTIKELYEVGDELRQECWTDLLKKKVVHGAGPLPLRDALDSREREAWLWVSRKVVALRRSKSK